MMPLRVDPADRLRVAGLSLASAAAFSVYLIGSRRRTRLTVVQDGLIYRSVRGQRFVATPSGSRVVEVLVSWSALSSRRSHLWILLGPDGRARVTLVADAFDHAQLAQVRHALGLPLERRDATVRPSTVRDVYPRALPIWTAHPNLVAAVLTVVLIAVFGAVLS